MGIVKNKEVEVELNEKRKEDVEKDKKYKTKYYKKKFGDESEIPVKGVSLEVISTSHRFYKICFFILPT